MQRNGLFGSIYSLSLPHSLAFLPPPPSLSLSSLPSFDCMTSTFV